MIALEYKLKGKQYQFRAIDDAIRTGQFVRNKALRFWMDNKGVNKYDLNKYCKKDIGRLKLVGSRDIYHYQPEQIKRVRLIRRADGYYYNNSEIYCYKLQY